MSKIHTEVALALLMIVLLLSLLIVVPASASTGGSWIADKIADYDHGVVRMTYAARNGVCGDGDTYISINGSTISWHRSGHWSDKRKRDCDEGPVRVTLKVRNGKVKSLKTRVGGRWSDADGKVLDLGEIPPQDAVDYLMFLAKHGRTSVAEDAILPAVLARDVVITSDLFSIARQRTLADDVRESAVFWLGQIAGEKITEGLSKLVEDDDVDLQVRETAVFALSQRNETNSTRSLMEIARTSPHPQLRKNALFWLAQRDDPHVLDFFEEILLEN